MNLKLLNVASVALVSGSLMETHRPRSRWRLLLGAALLDAFLIWVLTSERHAVSHATHMIMTPIRLIHISASACFPLMYPFLLLGELGEDQGPGRLSLRWLWLFAGLRGVSFLTSYFMAG
jgi:hypothetical protein